MSRRPRFASIAGVRLLPNTRPGVQFVLMRIPIETFQLPNGLSVVLSEDHTAPIVAVNLWYHVGSANEREGRTGFAHLFEHMLFQGSANVGSNEHFELIQRAGGTLNGSTWLDRTNYFETVPSNQLELTIWLEANRMGYLLPAMTQQKLDTQRDVVQNERRWSMDNQPYGTWWERLPALAFSAGASVPPLVDRVDVGSRRREPRRHRAVLLDVLHAGQRRALHRRRLRSKRSACNDRTALRRYSPWDGEASPSRHGGTSNIRWAVTRGRSGRRHASSYVHRLSLAGLWQRRVLRGERGRCDSRPQEGKPSASHTGARAAGCRGGGVVHL